MSVDKLLNTLATLFTLMLTVSLSGVFYRSLVEYQPERTYVILFVLIGMVCGALIIWRIWV